MGAEITKSQKRARAKRKMKLRMSQAQDCKCYYCSGVVWVRDEEEHGKSSLEATFEHLDPSSHGGANCKENIVIACYNCNVARSTYSHEDFKRIRQMKYWNGHWRKYCKSLGSHSHLTPEKQREKRMNRIRSKSVAFQREMVNRIKPYRAFVYV